MKNKFEIINPASTKIYYGWIILVLGALGMIMSAPGQTAGVSAFIDHLIKDIKIERDYLSLAYLLGTGLSALILGKAGKYYDKYGAKVMSVFAAALCVLILNYLSFSQIIVEKLRVILSSFSLNLSPAPEIFIMTAGFFLLRFSGQGVLTMVSRNVVMKWFEKNRGFAIGVIGVFSTFTFSYVPKLFNHLINQFSWSLSWRIVSLALIVYLIIALIFLRDNPHELGIADKEPANIFKSKKQNKQTGKRNYSLEEAKSTFAFWIYNLTLTLSALYFTAVTFHITSIFKIVNYSAALAVSIFLPGAVIAVIINFVGSWISDYIRLKYILLFQNTGIIISAIGIFLLGKLNIAIPLIFIGNGIANGCFGILSAVTWPRYYGLKHLGAISGYVMGWIVAGSAIGPYIFSLSEKFSGNYLISTCLCFALAILLFFAGTKVKNVNI